MPYLGYFTATFKNITGARIFMLTIENHYHLFCIIIISVSLVYNNYIRGLFTLTDLIFHPLKVKNRSEPLFLYFY